MRRLISSTRVSSVLTAAFVVAALAIALFGAGTSSFGLVLAAPADAPQDQYGVLNPNEDDPAGPTLPSTVLAFVDDAFAETLSAVVVIGDDLVFSNSDGGPALLFSLTDLPAQGSAALRETASDLGLVLSPTELPLVLGSFQGYTIVLFRLSTGNIQINVYSPGGVLVDDTVEIYECGGAAGCLLDRGEF